MFQRRPFNVLKNKLLQWKTVEVCGGLKGKSPFHASVRVPLVSIKMRAVTLTKPNEVTP